MGNFGPNNLFGKQNLVTSQGLVQILEAVWASTRCLMLKNEVKKPSYLVGSRLGSILGDFLRKLGDFFSKSSGHTVFNSKSLQQWAKSKLQH